MKDTHPSSYFLGQKWHNRRLNLIATLLEKYPYLTEERIVEILTDNEWVLSTSDKLYLLIKNTNPIKSQIVWNVLANSDSNEIKDLILMDESFLKLVGDAIKIEDLPKSGNIQHEVLVKYIEKNLLYSAIQKLESNYKVKYTWYKTWYSIGFGDRLSRHTLCINGIFPKGRNNITIEIPIAKEMFPSIPLTPRLA